MLFHPINATFYQLQGLSLKNQAVCEVFGQTLKGSNSMSWDRIEGEWKQRRGKAVRHWGKMMNDELAETSGKYEELVGRLQEKYGVAKEDAKRQVDEFKKIVNQLKKSNTKLAAMQKAQSKKVRTSRQVGKLKPLAKKSTRAKVKR
jgi:uncharacterized protein YjbJ (UPF0337 family)